MCFCIVVELKHKVVYNGITQVKDNHIWMNALSNAAVT